MMTNQKRGTKKKITRLFCKQYQNRRMETILLRKIPLINVYRLLSILHAFSTTLYNRSIEPLFKKNVTNFSEREPYNISSLGMHFHIFNWQLRSSTSTLEAPTPSFSDFAVVAAAFSPFRFSPFTSFKCEENGKKTLEAESRCCLQLLNFIVLSCTFKMKFCRNCSSSSQLKVYPKIMASKIKFSTRTLPHSSLCIFFFWQRMDFYFLISSVEHQLRLSWMKIL